MVVSVETHNCSKRISDCRMPSHKWDIYSQLPLSQSPGTTEEEEVDGLEEPEVEEDWGKKLFSDLYSRACSRHSCLHMIKPVILAWRRMGCGS